MKQRVECAPPKLPISRFDVLSIDPIDDTTDNTSELKVAPIKITPPQIRRPKWEKKLPRRPVIASLDPKGTSLHLRVELETTDTAERKSVQALVDCGATGSFIDRDFVRENKLNTRKLSRPIAVYNVDGSPNEAGEISEVVDILLRYKNHSERSLLAVTGLGNQKLLLGYTWLKEHNPEIDWQTGEVKMSHCPSQCAGCRVEAKAETKARKLQTRCIRACTIGPFPTLIEEVDDEDAVPSLDESLRPDPEDALEDGDRIFATGLSPPAENV